MKVLITGGTGLIGNRLTKLLHDKGYEVAYLSRSKKEGKDRYFEWNYKTGFIEEKAITYPDYIINLAGANLFDKRWTKEFKKEIIDSRLETVNLLFTKIKERKHSLKAFISASAIGYYGVDTGEKWIDEETPAGTDFLGSVVSQWERSVDQFDQLGIRTVKLRIGVVFDKNGGALPKLLLPIKLGAGSAIGSGKQYFSWIHIDDVCLMFIKAIEDPAMKGSYNAVAPESLTNKELTKEIAAASNRFIFLPNVSSIFLKIVLGFEKAMLVLGGNKISAKKIMREGYEFKFPTLKNALSDLLKKA